MGVDSQLSRHAPLMPPPCALPPLPVEGCTAASVLSVTPPPPSPPPPVEGCTAASVLSVTVNGIETPTRIFKPAEYSKALVINFTADVPYADEPGKSPPPCRPTQCPPGPLILAGHHPSPSHPPSLPPSAPHRHSLVYHHRATVRDSAHLLPQWQPLHRLHVRPGRPLLPLESLLSGAKCAAGAATPQLPTAQPLATPPEGPALTPTREAA